MNLVAFFSSIRKKESSLLMGHTGNFHKGGYRSGNAGHLMPSCKNSRFESIVLYSTAASRYRAKLNHTGAPYSIAKHATKQIQQ